MNAMVIVTTAESAIAVIRWGVRLARAVGHCLQILCCFFDQPPSPITSIAPDSEWRRMPLARNTAAAIEAFDDLVLIGANSQRVLQRIRSEEKSR